MPTYLFVVNCEWVCIGQLFIATVIDPIPPSLLSKYVAYARKYAHPRLSAEAAAVFQEVRFIATLTLFCLSDLFHFVLSHVVLTRFYPQLCL